MENKTWNVLKNGWRMQSLGPLFDLLSVDRLLKQMTIPTYPQRRNLISCSVHLSFTNKNRRFLFSNAFTNEITNEISAETFSFRFFFCLQIKDESETYTNKESSIL